MAEFRIVDSNYRFTQPIRYFKENDPYYHVIDNIPVKQLEENVLWLKDQLSGRVDVAEMNRSGFSELKPYVNESDNVIRVKPGRYSARINDAYNITPLQLINAVFGSNIGEFNEWEAHAIQSSLLKPTLERLKSNLAADALMLNGMAEKTFQSFFVATPESVYNEATYNQIQANIWNSGNQAQSDKFRIAQFYREQPSTGFASLAFTDTQFVKKWRGVARIAIVDVPNELSIEIPAFDANDFQYFDENLPNGYDTVSATHRLDLVFIYSKPIDMSATYIAEFDNNNDTTPRKITKSELGIIRGAGLKINFDRPEGNPRFARGGWFVPVFGGPDGGRYYQMLAHAADENVTDGGFTASGIHGSFPAPDDLLNIAPILMDNVAATNQMLIGQSILPVAYVSVKKDALVNSDGVNVITANDLVDIRPFFRTAELTYNERAGLAAAVPAPSLANPVVTEGQLDYELNRVYTDIVARLNRTTVTSPRIVGGGYIKSGYNFGVEGTLANYIEKRLSPGATKERLKQEVVARYGLPSNTVIPDYPEWDVAKWVTVGNFSDRGLYPNDYINFWYPRMGFEFSHYKDKELTERLSTLGFEYNSQWGNILFVKKQILIDRGQVSWMQDYHVDVTLWNCVHKCYRSHSRQEEAMAGGFVGAWVAKKYDRFIIYVAWVANDQNTFGPGAPPNGGLNPANYRTDGDKFGGFLVINDDIFGATPQGALLPAGNAPWSKPTGGVSENPGEINPGISIYPSVSFKIIGYPANYAGFKSGVPGIDPVIQLN